MHTIEDDGKEWDPWKISAAVGTLIAAVIGGFVVARRIIRAKSRERSLVSA